MLQIDSPCAISGVGTRTLLYALIPSIDLSQQSEFDTVLNIQVLDEGKSFNYVVGKKLHRDKKNSLLIFFGSIIKR